MTISQLVALGMLHSLSPEAGRDAVHFALAPVVALEMLRPGEHIRLAEAGGHDVMLARIGEGLGIVDPFLRAPVKGKYEGVWADDEFWRHYETVTGTTVAAEDRGGVFSCSC